MKFRKLIETCDKENTELVIDCFPVMSCKLASMLLAYHFLSIWSDIEIKGVRGVSGRGGVITHYWLEIDEIVIDITGDQYNIIDAKELTKAIVLNRPFDSVHVEYRTSSYLYDLFKIREKELLLSGFPTIGDDFIESMAHAHCQLLNQVKCS
ncbi:hypothetical protein GV64_04785 [Endozoicomonas elysicola]|uniref:Uncharacterized protein n=2 Tax=Endozoicomonas elysicola TaxID=305900 RepID=A0A081K7M5_9GAMM|nr:hypothetical protein GV64_04785 [Endozoicomonas elysicola]